MGFIDYLNKAAEKVKKYEEGREEREKKDINSLKARIEKEKLRNKLEEEREKGRKIGGW